MPSPTPLTLAIDGSFGSCSEGQGVRAVSSGGSLAMVIHRTGPYPAYGGPGPVTRATTGRQGRFGISCHLEDDTIRKGVKVDQVKLVDPYPPHV